MESPIEKFQRLLRELFQFDCADLDFGIYRIMNQKRDTIEKYIGETLPGTIAAALNDEKKRKTEASTALEKMVERVRNTLGSEAISSPDMELDKAFRDTKIGREYLEAKERAADMGDPTSIEAYIYAKLHDFFNRYYQDGDFVSKRRSSGSRHRYSIPYNGEEVFFHWANSDQYYVKTGEHFRDYDWKAPSNVAVRFDLRKVDVEQNNVKGDKRFFLPLVGDIQWNEKAKKVVIPFEYRPLTAQEDEQYSKRARQENIIAAGIDDILSRLSEISPDLTAALCSEWRPNDNSPVSHLKHHLRQYTQRNTSDFFIHKDLKRFLSRELDAYLKSEVLILDEMERAGEQNAAGWFQKMRLIKLVGNSIIDFLAQIENFQKLLWEKRKFVTETHYCIAVGKITTKLYPTILNKEEQWNEWQDLLGIDGHDRSESFLKSHPTLVLDTTHFDQDFTDSLLASFDDIDEITDGILIQSENWQALNLLSERYQQQVKCVHIDPPYNTRTSGFLYKNGYQHSSWLAMMYDRVTLGNRLLNENGNWLCHIDENEYEKLYLMSDKLLLPSIGTVVWDKRNPMTGGGGIATQHEYIALRSASTKPLSFRDPNRHMLLDKAERLITRDGKVTEKTKKDFCDWVSKNDCFGEGEKAYKFLDDNGNVYQSVSLRAPEPRTDPKFHKPLLHLETKKPCPVPPNGFSRTPKTLKSMLERGEILFGTDHTTQPRQKQLLNPMRQLSSIILDAKRGKTDLDALGLDDFPYCHSASFYLKLLRAASDQPSDLILDYFAGSGTTGHAVINLNREDNGRRKFILVEMGEYFDTVLLPRIKKVTYAPEWKDGKPLRTATPEEIECSPRIIKCIRLESYEDALNNIEFGRGTQLTLEDGYVDYLLRYMLRWETKGSGTLLNIEKLASPFSYVLRIYADGETRAITVDIPETFNYLLGLNVRSRRTYDDGGRRYLVYRGGISGILGRTVAVIWRKTAGWQEEDFIQDRTFVEKRDLAAGADAVYVNGDSLIPDAKPVERLFRDRMFAGTGT